MGHSMNQIVVLSFCRDCYQACQRLLTADLSAPERKLTLESFEKSAALSKSYLAFSIASCLLALLGLIISSPAVVIGAMLISPLMSPISSLGISLIRLDASLMKRALKTIFIGSFAAILITTIVSWLSPLQNNTAEILARTQPNLYDLMIALVGGLIAGYATIRRTGEGAVGVAIATALMPPLAVVGFCIATGQWVFARGAFMLFMTNLVAIAACIGLMGLIYGLGVKKRGVRFSYPLVIMMGVMIVLSVPLTFSLQSIVQETLVKSSLEKAVNEPFKQAKKDIYLQSLKLKRTPDGWSGKALVMTPEYVPNAEEIAQKRWAGKNKEMRLSIQQVVISGPLPDAQDDIVKSALQAPENIVPVSATVLTSDVIRSQFRFPIASVNANENSKTITIYAASFADLSLRTLAEEESTLQSRFTDWAIQVVPPVVKLNDIAFASGQVDLTPEAENALKVNIWALQRWNTKEVLLVSYTRNLRDVARQNSSSLSARRSKTIQAILQEAGISTSETSEYLSSSQLREANRDGGNIVQRISLRLP